MTAISFQEVGKIYPDGTEAVRSVTLDVTDGEFVVFVGPSGCGKSTLLRMLAGLETVTSGDVLLGDQRVNDVIPKHRDIAMVFQNYALYPHMSVRDNIGFALKQRGLPKAKVAAAVADAAQTLELDELLDRKPRQLSGGQRQRVALGRAIVRHPQALLLDEPLSNLDAKLRTQMRSELGRLHRSLGTTTVFVTHDQVEAMTLGSRVAVFSGGRLLQFDTPKGLYRSPSNIFVAGFVGSPSMNFIDATVLDEGELTLRLGERGKLTVAGTRVEPLLRRHGQERIIVGFRPESVSCRPSDHNGTSAGVLEADVGLVEHVEPESFLELMLADPTVQVRTAAEFEDGGDRDRTRDASRLVTARVRADEAPASGERVAASVDVRGLYVFDAKTTAAIR